MKITGITGDGILSLIIPENTIEDKAGNKNITKTFTTELSIEADNTDPKLTSIEVVSPTENGTFKKGQTIEFLATFEIDNNELYSNAASTTKVISATAPVLNIKFGNSEIVRNTTCTNVNLNQITYKISC